MKCNFCELYYSSSDNKNFKHYARLVRKTVINGEEKGSLVSSNHELNYCPTCGKKLEKEQLT